MDDCADSGFAVAMGENTRGKRTEAMHVLAFKVVDDRLVTDLFGKQPLGSRTGSSSGACCTGQPFVSKECSSPYHYMAVPCTPPRVRRSHGTVA